MQNITPTSADAAARASLARLRFHRYVDRRQKIDEEANSCRPGRRDVIVEDALHLAHGLLGGSDEECLIGAESQQPEGKHDKSNK